MSYVYGTKEWVEHGKLMLKQWVVDENAFNFLLDIGEIAEVWDDLIDKDKDVSDETINYIFTKILTHFPLNPFFDAYKERLIPIMIAGINAWQDANELEKGSENDRVFAYVLRDWYIELVMAVIFITRGYQTMRELSAGIRKFFVDHEPLSKYLEKLS